MAWLKTAFLRLVEVSLYGHGVLHFVELGFALYEDAYITASIAGFGAATMLLGARCFLGARTVTLPTREFQRGVDTPSSSAILTSTGGSFPPEVSSTKPTGVPQTMHNGQHATPKPRVMSIGPSTA